MLIPCILSYILHTHNFPGVPYMAGVYNIHSPAHFLETHGFALPGLEIIDTREPVWVGDCAMTEFKFRTHFNGPMTARLFSSTPDCSHLLIRDSGGSPCLMGRLMVRRLSGNGLSIRASQRRFAPFGSGVGEFVGRAAAGEEGRG